MRDAKAARRVGVVCGRGFRWRMRHLALSLATVVVASSFGCASPSAQPPKRDSSPLSALRAAIHAVLSAPSFTVVTTEFSPLLPLPRTVNTAVIQKPDRIALSGRSPAIAIGSIGYLPGPPGKWTVVHHVGESTNFTNSALVYLHVLDRTTSVTRHGDTYAVPSPEIVSLLNSTRLPEFHGATDVTWSATVRAGSLRSMTLHYDQPSQAIAGNCGTTSCTLPASPVTVTTTVSRVGTSPSINPPAQDSIVS
jgi:hypothetical protein